MESEFHQIPFSKADRVGNFKIWRSKVGGADAVNISTLDGGWLQRIPSTHEIYGIIAVSYSDYKSDDEARSKNGLSTLSTIFANCFYVSSIGNGYFQRAVTMCANIYVAPSLLDKSTKGHQLLLKETKSIIDGFLKWKEETDMMMKSSEPTKQDESDDDLAEQSINILKENKDEENNKSE